MLTEEQAKYLASWDEGTVDARTIQRHAGPDPRRRLRDAAAAAHARRSRSRCCRSAAGRWSTGSARPDPRGRRGRGGARRHEPQFAAVVPRVGRVARACEVHDDGTTSERRPARRDRRHPVRRRSRGASDDDLLVVAGDNLFDYCLADFIRWWHEKGEASAVAVHDVGSRELAAQYGIVDVDEDDRVVVVRREAGRADSRRSPRLRRTSTTATTCRSFDRYLDEGNAPDQPGGFVAWLVPRVPVYGYRLAGDWRDIGDAGQLLEADNRLRELAGLPLRRLVFPRLTRVPPVASTELQAEDIRWDLTDLCSDAEEARTQWTALVERAQELASRYRGRIASLDAGELRALLDEADELEQELSRLQVYSYLRLSMAATDVEANDLATFSRDRGAEIENALVFLGLEWIALDDEPAEALLAVAGARAVRAQAARRAAGEAVRPERARGAGAERAPPDDVRRGRRCTTGTSRRSRCPSTRARARSRTRSASCSRTSTAPTATSACERGDGALRGARAARRRARGLLRRARRRPAQHRPAARLRATRCSRRTWTTSSTTRPSRR